MSTISTISTMQLNLTARTYVAEATRALHDASQELSTGVKSDLYGELGARTAQLLSLRASEEETQAYISTNDILDSKLEAMLTATEAVREDTQGVLEISLVNASTTATGAEMLQEQAGAALESVIGALNTSFNGDYLFAGLDSDTVPLTRWSEVNDDTGTSPAAVLDGIVGSGPTTVAEAETMIAEIDAFFASANASAADNFEGTFYSGTPLVDGSGNEPGRVTAFVDEGQAVEYGVQANDGGFRDILKGLAMLAVIDVSEISDTATYSRWMDEVNEALSGGLEGALDASTAIGFNQQVVETAQSRLEDISLVQTTQISDYESVDPYEAATMVETLETQLEASYTITARLASLSLLNYL